MCWTREQCSEVNGVCDTGCEPGYILVWGIGEKRVTIHATTTVVALRKKPVIVPLEPVKAETLGITERTVQIFVAQAAVGQTTPVTLTPSMNRDSV